MRKRNRTRKLDHPSFDLNHGLEGMQRIKQEPDNEFCTLQSK